MKIPDTAAGYKRLVIVMEQLGDFGDYQNPVFTVFALLLWWQDAAA